MRTKEEADKCCAPVMCAICGGGNVRLYNLNCDACAAKKLAAREAERFERAEKVTDWDGPVFLEGLGGAGYFANVGELEDWLSDQVLEDGSQPARPGYVWTCESSPCCQLDYDTTIELATRDAFEDWGLDDADIAGETELRTAIEDFNNANAKHVSWEPNFQLALVLGAEAKTSNAERRTPNAEGKPAAGESQANP